MRLACNLHSFGIPCNVGKSSPHIFLPRNIYSCKFFLLQIVNDTLRNSKDGLGPDGAETLGRSANTG